MSVIFFSTSSILSSSITTAKKNEEKSRSERSYLGLAGGGSLTGSDGGKEREGAPHSPNSPILLVSARGPSLAFL